MDLRRQIKGGLYLVIDPAMEEALLLEKLRIVLASPIAAVQVWDNFPDDGNPEALLEKVIVLCQEKNVPVLINNRWELLAQHVFDGVHFDQVPDHLASVRSCIKRPFLVGITCGNELSTVAWADGNAVDYLSFCSIFPSQTSNSCELVLPETIQKAREMTALPIFLAGGIRPENLNELEKLSFDGIAVVSGIMRAAAPEKAISAYLTYLNP
ncbi:hypothetical protein P872_11725 [Rhodonellum psychrophilum GCM71 = DSM 17998]|uniref:Thiamine phosphate synthase/TenI domain-containing protein n=2 Tax=Rhodonellum TaxID=336827 RepID=U5BTW5_9BACT|nr:MULTISPECIES: thiamine phosphate synthase [Rhodonellum]ERM80969.1 hypothetical protein P872_11725 [Rhodonellum psychrophilum GCM71 = DSM 17998]SDZ55435.1 thiamine-phosphate pyrophosphorylase [Rhodonellum ikkaensis]